MLEELETRSIRSLLVVAPHPDDETIGCGGLIQRVLGQGGEVSVVVLSSGERSHPGSRAYPPARLSQLRRLETLAALCRLGVAAYRVRFAELEDGGGAQWLGEDGLFSVPHDTAAIPAPHDNHVDHRAARRLYLEAGGAARTLSYCVWPSPASPEDPFGPHALTLSDRELRNKRHAMRCYATQSGMIRDSADGFVIDHPLLERFTAPVERFS